MARGIINKIYIGKVKEYGDDTQTNPFDKKWKTAAFKKEVMTAIYLTKLGLETDEQADKKHHGGSEKALFMYPKSNYPILEKEMQKEIPVGGNGENISILNIDENDVCLGDVYKLGDSIIEVSQPRRPCWKPARRHRKLEFSVMIQNLGMTGWYFRVLKEGMIYPNSKLKLIKRPCKEWTIKSVNDVMYVYTDNLGLAESLIDCKYLPDNFKQTLKKRISGQKENNISRLYGPNL